MRTAEREREEARQRVAAAIADGIAGLTVERALQLMTDATIRHTALRAVDRHLAEHPDALLAGEPDSPLGLQRLAQVLYAAGFTTVRLVGCARCGRSDARLAWVGLCGRI